MVERLLAKEKVEGSNPFFRSTILSNPRLLAFFAMATTSATTFTEDLRADIQAALESGVPKDDLLDMVNIAYLQMATAAPPAATDGHSTHNVHENDQELPIYTELPPGMIVLPSAARKYGCSRERVHGWVKRGVLQVHGRLKGAARGGGYLVVIEDDVKHILATIHEKGGRPRKTVHMS